MEEVKKRKEELINALIEDFKKNEGNGASDRVVTELKERLEKFTIHSLELLAKGAA